MTTSGERRRVQSGEVTLAAWVHGPANAPVVVLSHGYPDTHEVWAGVAAVLAERFRVIAYDTRGVGESTIPADGDFGLSALRDDLRAVIAELAPGKAVHLVGHDWGGIAHWEAATEPGFGLASFTSIAGPCLDHVGHWLRGAHRHPVAVARQLAKSWYVGAFQLPGVPSALWNTVGRAWPSLLRHLEGVSEPRLPDDFVDDAVTAAALYRQNMLARVLKPRARHAQCPVQLVVPLDDRYEQPELASASQPFVRELWQREVRGGHWLPRAQPEVLAGWIAEWVDFREGGAEPIALRRARVGGAPVAPLAVITGGASGIGRATALALARQGKRLVLADLDLEGAQATAEACQRLGVEAFAEKVDVSDAAAMEAFAGKVLKAHGAPWLVMNNAGIGMAGSILDTSVRQWQRVLDVNLWGVLHGSRLFAKQMIAAGQGGHVVNVASAAAFAPSRTLPAYATSKAAVLMLTECLRAELAPHGIGVSAICPGLVETPITRRTTFAGSSEAQQARQRERAEKLYRRRAFPPEKVAEAVLEAIAGDRPVVPVALEAHALQWLGRLAPGLSRRLARVDLSPK